MKQTMRHYFLCFACLMYYVSIVIYAMFRWTI